MHGWHELFHYSNIYQSKDMQDKVFDKPKKKKKVASDFERGKGKRKMKTHFGGINLQAICCFRKKH